MRQALVVLVVLTALTLPAVAQKHEITPLVGWQEGGELEVDSNPDDLDGAPVFGLMFSFRHSRETTFDLLYSHQATEVEAGDFFERRVEDVAVDYLHFGGRYLFAPDERFDPYVGFTIGGTRVGVDDESVVGLSGALAAGTDIAITDRVALRLDGRYFVTLASSSSEISCNSDGECTSLTEGNSFSQIALTAGVAIRFGP